MTARLSPKQTDFLLNGKSRVNIAHGSVRSSKSLTVDLAFMHFLATDCPTEGRPVIIGNTLDTIYRNVISEMINLDPHAVQYTKNATTARIYGREVDVIGAPDVKAERRIRGMTIPAFLVDEGSLLPDLGFWQQLLNRQITLPGARGWLTTNPDNPLHWLKADVIDKADQLGYFVRHFVPTDNPILTPEAIAILEAQNTGVWYKRNVLGEWVIADGVIYDGFDLERHVVSDLPEITEWVVALDPGGSSTHAAVLLGLGPDAIFVCRAWTWVAKERQHGLTPVEVASHLDGWLQRCEEEIGQRIDVWQTVVDSEDWAMVTQLYRDGSDTGRFPGRFGRVQGAEKGPGSVVSGIRTVGSLLATDRLRVHDSCQGLVKEMQTYSWDPKSALLGQDKPIKANDHECDALRYGTRVAYTWWRDWISAPAPVLDEAA